MSDDRLLQEVRAWLQDEHIAVPDPEQAGRLVASRLPETRQRRRRWSLRMLGRSSGKTGARATIDLAPPIPITSSYSADVTGRTQSMLSPAKAIAAGAVVFAIGSVLVLAQPFGPTEPVPGTAGSAASQPVPFTVRFMPVGSSISGATTTNEEGVVRSKGRCWGPRISEPSDPRLDGQLIICGAEDAYLSAEHGWVTASSSTYRIENAEGAWEGSAVDYSWTDPSSGESTDTKAPVVLMGEGAYAGLHATLAFTHHDDIRGFIFPGPPPAAPELPRDR
jgi:hypothetical protein